MTTEPRSSLGLAELIRARLEERQSELEVKAVYGLLDISSDSSKSLSAPCVAAYMLADDFAAPTSADDDEVVVQRHTATVSVLCAVPAINDPGGLKGRTRDRLSPLVAATRRALLGWPPEGEHVGREVVRTDAVMRSLIGPAAADLAADAARWRPLVLRRGRLMSFGDGQKRAWWQDEYATHRLVRGVLLELFTEGTPDTLCVSVRGGAPEPLEEVT